MINRASFFSILSRAITLAWLRALSLGLLGVMLVSTRAEAKPFAYVTNFFSNNVSVIDTATNTVVATVPVGTNPNGVAISPYGTHAYVTNGASNTVSVILTATNTVVTTVPVGSGPFGVAVTPDGTYAYITNGASNNVSVIATATNTVVATVPVGSTPRGVAITPYGNQVFVVNNLSNNVSVIDTATNTVVATVAVGFAPFGMAITPDGTRAYVADGSSNAISVIDTATSTVVATVSVGSDPRGVAITPDGSRAYVTNVLSDTVSVIDTATNAVVATVPGLGLFNSAVAITTDGIHAYVTSSDSNTTAVIDTATNTVVANVPVGSFPSGVAITPNQVRYACPLTQGFWETHPDSWPVTSLTLGSQTYTQAELLALLATPPSYNADASLILASQLIAAKLNIAKGSDPAQVIGVIVDADNLLSQFTGKLPYNVGTYSVIGRQMVNDANVLNRYNNCGFTTDCRP